MSSRTDLLSEILRKAEGLKTLLQGHKPLPGEEFTSVPLPIPPLQLPSADSILSNFRSLPDELLDRCASTLVESAEAAQRNYEMAYRALYSSTQPTQDRKAHKLRHSCEQIYCCTIISPMQNLLSSARQRTTRANSEIRDSGDPKLRTRFRQEYVPFLEQRFQSNAYPSNIERAYLARETKMSERQIEVWFQNHRNRARREGKILRRANINAYMLGSVAENHVSSDSSGYESESSSPCSEQESFYKADTVTQLCVPPRIEFDIKTPAYAFPTRYSQGRSMDKIERIGFSTDLWMRKSANASRTAQEAINIDELIVLFSKQLTIQDVTIPRRKRTHHRPSVDSSRQSAPPWYTATTTFPPKAPYFALVRTQVNLNPASTKIPSLKNAPTLRSSQAIVHGRNDMTTPSSQSYSRSRQRVSSPSLGSTDESSCNELITPPSSPPASVFLPKTLPDWTIILESVAA